jgi:hypothetical protein
MTRKLFLFAGAMILVLMAWTSKAEAIGLCSCTLCKNTRLNCFFLGSVWRCADYYSNYC